MKKSRAFIGFIIIIIIAGYTAALVVAVAVYWWLSGMAHSFAPKVALLIIPAAALVYIGIDLRVRIRDMKQML